MGYRQLKIIFKYVYRRCAYLRNRIEKGERGDLLKWNETLQYTDKTERRICTFT